MSIFSTQSAWLAPLLTVSRKGYRFTTTMSMRPARACRDVIMKSTERDAFGPRRSGGGEGSREGEAGLGGRADAVVSDGLHVGRLVALRLR